MLLWLRGVVWTGWQVKEAGTSALQDAGIEYSDVEQACVGYGTCDLALSTTVCVVVPTHPPDGGEGGRVGQCMGSRQVATERCTNWD